MLSTVRDKFTAWVARDEAVESLSRFRRAFALIWLAYDGLDLLWSGTASCADWLVSATRGAPVGLVAIQVLLVVCEYALFAGLWIPLVACAAVVLRSFEAFAFFRLNDFLYYIVTASFLVFSAPEGERGSSRVPVWVRAALLFETGWIYLATATLKLNPAFLSGGHFLVRHTYLAQAHWPYPPFMRPWLESLTFNAAVSALAVASEFTLGCLLLARRVRRLAIGLAIGIHVIAALTVNVWFFGASMIAQVALLFPRPEERAGAPDLGAPASASHS